MLDERGFKRRRFADLFDEMEGKAREAFGEQVNTAVRSPLGIILRIFAWFLAMAWSLAESVYNSAYVGTAIGTSLDRLGAYVGITRIPQRPATGEVQIEGTAGYTVAISTVFGTKNGVLFETLNSITLESNGRGMVKVRGKKPGIQSNVAAGTITEIINPVPDITAVTNPAPSTGGREKETDSEFRERFRLSVAGGGAATLDSLRGALLRVFGVRAAAVVENNSLQTDGAGRPGKSFQCYLLGGDDNDIAQTILNTKAAGIEPFGDIEIIRKDIAGEPHTVKFSRAEEVRISLKVLIGTDNRFPIDGDRRICSELVRYIGGNDEDGSIYVGLNMGQSVVFSQLVATALKVEGTTDVSYEIKVNGQAHRSENINISIFQVAQTSAAEIEVVHSV
ncbi:baseplate J/gp47 family protein [Paenibacillus albiflavus]|uniref:Baseplate J/gp47 family protein n=1 Tax=Paenibacillus albiflavus TaxID=2545760 RepID=A0A4R4EAB1_9BACL|nr:baseplate J/gp47 family protein [Paenibacillus albiflavus]TCZ76187.1 baseplate J/gp47 family protein [Paenibacillus albiflavus]